MSGGNLLLLDFAGRAVVISHDRWLLDRIVTHILPFEGNSEVMWHEGNYQSYIEDLKKRKAPTPTSRTASRTRNLSGRRSNEHPPHDT
jgi:energy-dependent translational throttle protein EttA